MIVKSIPHKHRNFQRLINYIFDDRGRYDPKLDFDLCHNIRSYSKGDIIAEFKENAKLKKRRENGTELYHDILSFCPKDRRFLTLDKIYDLSRRYVELRGDKGLCFAKPHLHQDHLHVHFCFSGNQYQSEKSLRLTMKKFSQIRVDLELYQMRCFPELTNSLVYLKKRTRAAQFKNIESSLPVSQEKRTSIDQSARKEKKMTSRIEDMEKLTPNRTKVTKRIR